MGLVTSNTNLKSLKFGKDRPGGGSSNQPYITKDIPSNNSDPSPKGTTDFLLRGGLSLPSRIFNDTSRLTQMFLDTKSPSGIFFTEKQNLLSRTGVKTQGSGALLNEGAYIPTSSILQAAGNPLGLHLNKQGLDPTKGAFKSSLFDVLGINDPLGLPIYSSIVKSNQPTKENRLVRLKNEKIGKSPISLSQPSIFINQLIDNIGLNLNGNNIVTDPNILFKYSGGPGSVLGVGKTTIRRYSNTINYDTEEFRKGHYLLNSSQIATKQQSKDATYISNFIEDIIPLQARGIKKNVISKSLNYSDPNKRIEGRVNLGDPGKRNKDTSDFTKGMGALDRLNAYPIYQSNSPKINDPNTPVNDLVKFRIGIINNENPNQKQYIHFRAFIDSFNDGYNAEHSIQKYMGRGENFYKYQGFDRKINMSWTVAAQSKEELIPMYHKLNYLASAISPDYSEEGYMRGNLVSLTVGGYLYEQVGILHSILYTVPEESPWEIGIDTEGGYDSSVKELPHIIRVTGFQFTPIHSFRPSLQKNEYKGIGDGISEFGEQRYISLNDGSNNNNYDSETFKNRLEKGKPIYDASTINDGMIS